MIHFPRTTRGGQMASAVRGPARVLLAFSLVMTGQAPATEGLAPGADLSSIHHWLLKHNPELRAQQAELEAAQARILPAGALPNPMVGLELEGIDPSGLSLAPAQVGSSTWRIRQNIPLWGKRELMRSVAKSEAGAIESARARTILELLASADQAYVRFWQVDETIAVVDRLIGLLDQMGEVAQARYALGVAAQQDAIRAQVARTQMQAERIERLAMREDAAAMLNAVLGRPADAPLRRPQSAPEFALPVATLKEALTLVREGQHPAVASQRAMAAAASQAAEWQRRQRYPDLSLGLGAMQVGNRIEGYELMIELEVPLQRRALYEREHAAVRARDAAGLRVEATLTELQGQLGVAWSVWDSARSRRQLIEQTLLPQTQANFDSALASYRVGDVDFSTLLEALEAWQGADLARLDARRDELSAAASLRSLLGSNS